MKKLAFILCLFLSIHVSAQSGDTTHEAASKQPTALASKNDPLIILDDVVYKDAVNNINPDDIHDITVLKGASATALYGSDAANGAIIIKTKKYANALKQTSVLRRDTSKISITLDAPRDPKSKPLIVLDDVIYKGDIKSIDPNTIESIVVLKGAKAEALYGSKAAAGAIVIETKAHQKAAATIKINIK